MSWVRLDDQFADHPKVASAGPLAAWLHVKAIVYCARYLTDGFVPLSVALSLVDWSQWGVACPPGIRPESGGSPTAVDVDNTELIAALIEVGLWDAASGGFQIHDYLDHNPSRESVLSARKAEKERKSRGRSTQGRDVSGRITAGQPAVSARNPAGVRPESEKLPPVPSPSPSPSPEEKPRDSEISPSPAAPVRRDPKPAKAPASEPAAPAGYQAVIAAYFAAFERAKGVKPVFASRTGKAAKTLLALMPEAEVIAAIDRAFADAWFVSTAGELWDIASEPNKWRGAGAAMPFQRPGKAPAQPGNGHSRSWLTLDEEDELKKAGGS